MINRQIDQSNQYSDQTMAGEASELRGGRAARLLAGGQPAGGRREEAELDRAPAHAQKHALIFDDLSIFFRSRMRIIGDRDSFFSN